MVQAVSQWRFGPPGRFLRNGKELLRLEARGEGLGETEQENPPSTGEGRWFCLVVPNKTLPFLGEFSKKDLVIKYASYTWGLLHLAQKPVCSFLLS